ncbi:CRISPR-associated protein Cas4/endonuclease Cas1 fusion [Aquisphaera giovannonii]|uniref:CRISPR-associated endonuclease Cas1 n=1 Tax=Aquisphaera giovannonii TaxID=406548 RepID=A0A5B9VVA6_9BACT|nr:type I-C CRISPR-associated endonuclease Cas1c [Aquisphaera giovannonii]QEH32079.1 CRISPR-associated protein Cas4/endonuclease Cas1 fusion [Aquisphaera giovannonii]
MKTHLNTLYITTQGTYLGKSGESVQVRAEGKVLAQLPLHNLEGVVCFGRVGCSPSLLGACAERGVSVSLLTQHGRFLAAVRGNTSGNVLLRRQQYRLADRPEVALDVARRIVLAKVANSRSVLLRAARDCVAGDAARLDTLRREGGRLAASAPGLREATTIDQVRGLEGEAATHYFGAFDALLSPSASAEAFRFTGRSRRPPLDRINALLSFLYTLVLHDARSACESVGLDPCVGFLHADRPGKPALALDLMEEFRAFVADRLAFSLINRRQVSADGFEVRENGAVLMNDATRKAVLAAYQQRKRETLAHPFLEEQTTVGMLVHLQALLLARWIRGDLDAYPPFLWKG